MRVTKTKVPFSCFRIGKNPVFSRCGSFIHLCPCVRTPLNITEIINIDFYTHRLNKFQRHSRQLTRGPVYENFLVTSLEVGKVQHSLSMAGLFLYTKLGPVSGTKFFPSWLKKFPIDLNHFQVAEKSQFKRLTFPILLKIALFFPKIVVYFPKFTQFFPNMIGTKNFTKKVRKSPGMEQRV